MPGTLDGNIQAQLTDLFNPENFRQRVEQLRDPNVRDQLATALAQQPGPAPDPNVSIDQSIGMGTPGFTQAGVPQAAIPPAAAPPVPPQVDPSMGAVSQAQQAQRIFTPEPEEVPNKRAPGGPGDRNLPIFAGVPDEVLNRVRGRIPFFGGRPINLR